MMNFMFLRPIDGGNDEPLKYKFTPGIHRGRREEGIVAHIVVYHEKVEEAERVEDHKNQ
jgi:hypothetical protein